MMLSGPGQKVTGKPSDDIKKITFTGRRAVGLCCCMVRQEFYLAVMTEKNSIS